ncbi:hypothetical protein J6590_039401 [Homalodisca vitripennis]|nr:hypothetical protein J6590_039401 [Homalodisca vitripennis]
MKCNESTRDDVVTQAWRSNSHPVAPPPREVWPDTARRLIHYVSTAVSSNVFICIRVHTNLMYQLQYLAYANTVLDEDVRQLWWMPLCRDAGVALPIQTCLYLATHTHITYHVLVSVALVAQQGRPFTSRLWVNSVVLEDGRDQRLKVTSEPPPTAGQEDCLGLLSKTGLLSGHPSKQQPHLIRLSCDNSFTRYSAPLATRILI